MLCSFSVSSEKARTELGYRARPNREGLAQTLRRIQETAESPHRPEPPA